MEVGTALANNRPAQVKPARKCWAFARRHLSSAAEGDRYGRYMADVGGHQIAFQTGGNAGFQSINAMLPEDDARFVALINDNAAGQSASPCPC